MNLSLRVLVHLGVAMISPAADESPRHDPFRRALNEIHPALELFRNEKEVNGSECAAYKRGLPVDGRSVLLDPHRTGKAIEGSSFDSMHDWVHRKTRPDYPGKPKGRNRLVSLGTRKKISKYFFCTGTIADAVAKELDIKDVRDILWRAPQKLIHRL